MRRACLWMCVLASVYSWAWAVEDPLAKDHMSAEVFMEAAWHMKIEGVEESPDKIVVTTTGATFAFVPATDTLTCSQRIGKERRVLTVWLGGKGLAGLKVAAKDTGAVILTSEAGLTAKVNCDSLLMLRTAKPIGVTFRHEFKEAVTYHAPDNRLWIDAFGAAYLCGAIDGSKHCLLPCHNDGICSDNAYSGCVDSMDDGAGACGFAFLPGLRARRRRQ